MGQDQDDQFWNLVAKRLSGEATAEDLKALEQLLRKNPELHYPLQTITGLWKHASPEARSGTAPETRSGTPPEGRSATAAETRSGTPGTPAEEAFDRHLSRMKSLGIEIGTTPEDQPDTGSGINRIRTRRTRRGLVLASILAMVTLAVGFLYRSMIVSKPVGTTLAANTLSEVTTHYGSRTNLYLPDGTRVWLNAGSSITYDKNFGATGREVTLSGEAFFDVAPNPARPFLIHAARIDIKVLGTSFNVKSYPTDKTTETVLIRGSIEVALKGKTHEKIILKPNEKLIVANEDTVQQTHPVVRTGNPPAAAPEESHVTIRKPTYEKNTGAIVETSWVHDELIFQGEKFSDLALKMERWYGVSIHFADSGIEDMRLTGTFRDETIQEALEALKLTAPFSYTINDNQITIAK
jgi:transmembrane sensor